MCCDLGKPTTCCTRQFCISDEKSVLKLFYCSSFFLPSFIIYSLWTEKTVKKFWKQKLTTSNFHHATGFPRSYHNCLEFYGLQIRNHSSVHLWRIAYIFIMDTLSTQTSVKNKRINVMKLRFIFARYPKWMWKSPRQDICKTLITLKILCN